MIHRKFDLFRAVGKNRSAFLFGPRGSGKTWLCREFQKTQPATLEIDLLGHELYRRYISEPGAFREDVLGALPKKGLLSVFVDEIQRLPELLNEVHWLLESYPGRVRFLLTGSSARKLKRGGANLLAGRALVLHLHPLCSDEGPFDLNKTLRFGSLPGMCAVTDPAARLSSYVGVYLKEEIQQEALVRKVESYFRFLDVAAQMNGEPINFASVARDVGVETKTAQEFVSILVDTLVAFRVEPWTWSVRKQLRHSPKIYFFDCGVLNAVRGDLHAGIRPSSYGYGKLFETFVVQEFHRWNDYAQTRYRFFYWRTNIGTEVDLVLSRGLADRPVAVEIKSATSPGEKDVVGLKAFKSDNPSARVMCFCRTPFSYRKGGIEFVPWQKGLKELFS